MKGKERWIVKLSSHELTDVEKQVFEKGLKFAPTTRSVPIVSFIAGVEPVLQYHPDKIAAEGTKSKKASILRNAAGKKQRQTITKDECEAWYERSWHRGMRHVVVCQRD